MENREKLINLEQQERKEQFSDLIIFTTTFYGEDKTSLIRAELAENLFANAKELGISCVVVDGGSTPQFLKKVEQFDNVKLIVEPSLGIGESRRHALQEAMQLVPVDKKPNFLWTEPEKSGLVTENNLKAMIEGLRDGKTDIVVPLRKNKDSLPKFQAWIESRANKRAKKTAGIPDELIEEEIDLWFGPKMFNFAGAEYFLNYKGKLDKWDAIIKPVIDAYNDKKRISIAPVDFTYDQSQRQDEEGSKDFRRKRVEQYTAILAELGDEFWKDKFEKKE